MISLQRLVKDNIFVLLIFAALATAWFLFRTTPSDIESLQALDAKLHNGQPTIIEFYSNT